ncbi:MAG: PrsW family intramembrane metalloprotease [Lachnospiraceae bacterium]|nr:PrsW family intramembrane metalloprotease [Lachnospiraceae bacterium]
MPVVQLIISLIVLGILYSRMIRRESPGPIAKTQAIVPVILGAVSTVLSFLLFLAIGFSLDKAGFSSQHLPAFIRSVIAAFISAGLPEEITKFLMILLALLVFHSRLRNVYEYILIGAAVGLGFTLLEEFFYGSDSVVTAIARLITIASHMVFGIIMAKHLGTAKYNRIKGSGSVTGEYVLAFLVPILLHTLYDAGTATNVYMNSGDEDAELIGIAIALAVTVALFIVQIVVLVRLKRNTEKYCGMVISNSDIER